MTKKYRQYRSYGHTRTTSALAAVPFLVIVAIGAVIGALIL